MAQFTYCCKKTWFECSGTAKWSSWSVLMFRPLPLWQMRFVFQNLPRLGFSPPSTQIAGGESQLIYMAWDVKWNEILAYQLVCEAFQRLTPKQQSDDRSPQPIICWPVSGLMESGNCILGENAPSQTNNDAMPDGLMCRLMMKPSFLWI